MIDVNKAVYCWEPKTGKADVVSFPMGRDVYPNWSTAGAVLTDYTKLNTERQKFMLLIEAWQSVVRDGIDPKQAHAALLKVKGMSGLFADDCQAL